MSNSSLSRYNPASLGVPNVRKVAMSRGSKEGINALTKVSLKILSFCNSLKSSIIQFQENRYVQISGKINGNFFNEILLLTFLCRI